MPSWVLGRVKGRLRSRLDLGTKGLLNYGQLLRQRGCPRGLSDPSVVRETGEPPLSPSPSVMWTGEDVGTDSPGSAMPRSEGPRVLSTLILPGSKDGGVGGGGEDPGNQLKAWPAVPAPSPQPPGAHSHKSQHRKSRPDTRPWKQTDKRVVGTLERWGRPAPVSAEGGGRVPALPMGLAF